ncbi:hypothetical protein [Tersicoccus sp. Bi-70]|uniref:hypothetical protein n=1 Tax=Tersicoccus sp. Bi-70 TaxID=1897634 RepID=UPI00117D30CB|nr:hypothetical protein [Tersicoccus sp. Bi-70]
MDVMVSTLVTFSVPAFIALLLLAVVVVVWQRHRFLTRMAARAEKEAAQRRIPERPTREPRSALSTAS